LLRLQIATNLDAEIHATQKRPLKSQQEQKLTSQLSGIIQLLQ